MRLYVASSWRNQTQPSVVLRLRSEGHEVYDFRNPAPGQHGFSWSEIDPQWKGWNPALFREALLTSRAEEGFKNDWDAMVWADAGVLLLPSGRSAHIEAGYFVGAGKPLYILLSDGEPELMYKMATKLCLSLDELCRSIGAEVSA